MYYHFYEYNDPEHHAARHYGVRTDRYKLIHFYHPTDEWEFFDLKKDPHELNSVYADPSYAGQVAELKTKLKELRAKYQDTDGDDPTVNDEGPRVKQ
jgi:arylsulfatase A-like enzyme